MTVVPLAMNAKVGRAKAVPEGGSDSELTRMAASGALIAGGLLFLFGHRRAGTVAAASGAALALLDQKEAVCKLWERIPDYIEGAQRVANQVQETLEEIAVKREKLRRILLGQG
jgi:hypothetical protein